MHRTSVLLSVILVVLVGLVAVGRRELTTAQDAADAQGLVGSWRTTVSIPGGPPPSTSLSTIHDDGTIVSSGFPAQVPPPGSPVSVIFVSSGHGSWEATGPNDAIFTFVEQWADGQGDPLLTLTVNSTATLGDDGQTFTGSFDSTIADLTGNIVASFPGTVQGTRIVAEGPATSMGATPTS
jgi:hypothetical protein